jgi:hypothetical protein
MVSQPQKVSEILRLAEDLSPAERRDLLARLARLDEPLSPATSAARLLEAMKSAPIPPQDILDEWDRVLRARKRPAQPGGVFDDLIEGPPG